MAKKKKLTSVKIKEVPYYKEAKVTCSCGANFTIGSTKKEIQVEICSMCHPFYTGTQKLVDTSGRVDKFRARLAKKEKIKNINKKDNNKPTPIIKPTTQKIQ